jgi:hypothetical protein
MGRKPPGVILNGDKVIHVPGAYAEVLQTVCAEAVEDSYASLAAEESEAASVRREEVARIAQLMRERSGEPVGCTSYQLPDGLPTPFEHWPPGAQRTFTVTPDDVVTLRPRPTGTGTHA